MKLATLTLSLLLAAPTTYPPVDLAVDCQNTDAYWTQTREPIQTWWPNQNEWPQGTDIQIGIYNIDTDTTIGVIDIGNKDYPSEGYHDNWLGAAVPIDGQTIRAIFIATDPSGQATILAEAEAHCPAPTTTADTPPPPVNETPQPTDPPSLPKRNGTPWRPM